MPSPGNTALALPAGAPRLRSAGGLVAAIALLMLGMYALLQPPAPPAPVRDDYAGELSQADQAIAALAAAPQNAASPLAELRYRRALLAGDTAALVALREGLSNQTPAGAALLARLDLALHQWPQVAARLAQLPDTPATQRLRAQALLQGGDTSAATALLHRLAGDGDWEALAALAGLAGAQGRYGEADTLYAAAGEQLDARQMRAYSWILLQRGYLQLRRGDPAAALRWYDQAERAYAGHWLSDDYQAEALAAVGQTAAAITRYRQAIAKAARPELQQALGELYQFLGQPQEAKPWLDSAEQAYLAATARGGVHYLHHLAYFYAQARPDGTKAVAYAQRELALRPLPASQALLARALYRDGQYIPAQAAMQAALSGGLDDSDTWRQAALIELALGHAAAGQDALARAAALDPQPLRFHVHR